MGPITLLEGSAGLTTVPCRGCSHVRIEYQVTTFSGSTNMLAAPNHQPPPVAGPNTSDALLLGNKMPTDLRQRFSADLEM